MAESEQRDVVVIGGGISGLACAWRLVQAGLDAALIERSDRPGGVISTHRREGFLTEAGPNTVQGAEEIFELVREVGLEDELLEADAGLPRYIFLRGELHAVPFGPLALISTRILSGRAKLRLLREPWISKRATDEEESIAQFVTRRFGREVLDHLVSPLVSGIYAGDTAALSMQSVFPMLAELEAAHGSVVRGFLFGGRSRPKPSAGETHRRRTLISFRDGLETLPRRIVERLKGRVRLGTPACGLEADSIGGGNLRVLAKSSAGDLVVTARAVVMAASASTVAELVEPLAPAAGRSLRSIPYAPLACVSAAYPRSAVSSSLDGFGFLVPRGQGIRILGCVWNSSLFRNRAPESWICLTNFLGGAVDPEAAALGDVEVAKTIQDGLGRALGATGEPRLLAIDRYAGAIPQYRLGHGSRLAEIQADLSRVPGLFLAGSYLSGVSVGDCVKQAKVTADAVIAHLRSRG